MPAVERSPFDREDETRGTRRVVAHRVGHHGRDTLLQPLSLGDKHSAEKDHVLGFCDSYSSFPQSR